MTGLSTPPASTRQRILDAAVELIAASGWSSVTMGALAAHAGVSRQTVYNEIGTKADLADAVVLDELGRFLAVVELGFDRHPRDLHAALRTAVLAVLDRARDSPLLRAIVTSTTGADTELLPPLTTRSATLVDASRSVLLARLDGYDVAAGPARRDAVVDVVVRAVLSHVMQPPGDTRRTATGIAGVATAALG